MTSRVTASTASVFYLLRVDKHRDAEEDDIAERDVFAPVEDLVRLADRHAVDDGRRENEVTRCGGHIMRSVVVHDMRSVGIHESLQGD